MLLNRIFILSGKLNMKASYSRNLKAAYAEGFRLLTSCNNKFWELISTSPSEQNILLWKNLKEFLSQTHKFRNTIQNRFNCAQKCFWSVTNSTFLNLNIHISYDFFEHLIRELQNIHGFIITSLCIIADLKLC